LLAALGAVMFALAPSSEWLLAGRFLIGIGVSVCLGGAFKALAHVFQPAHLPLINGLVMAVGGLGGVATGTPLTWGLSIATWREISGMLALLTLLIAALIWISGDDEHEQSNHHDHLRLRDQFRGIATVFKNREFWRIASFSSVTQGVFYAMQSLWVGTYMSD